jgi:hypothetical protein
MLNITQENGGKKRAPDLTGGRLRLTAGTVRTRALD